MSQSGRPRVFRVVYSRRTIDNGHKLKTGVSVGSSKLDMRKNISAMRTVKWWNRLLRGFAVSPLGNSQDKAG